MSGVRGPKNPDDYRIDYYRSRHYVDVLPECPLRPEGPMPTDSNGDVVKKGNVLPAQSTIMKAIPTDALLYWAVGKTAEYAVDEREKWEKLDRDDAVDLLKKAHRKSSGKAADRGSSLHEYLDARLRGEDFDVFHLHEDAVPYVPVVDLFLDREKPELVLSEVVGIGHEHGVTTDAVLRFPRFDDELDVADWKTRNDTVKKPHVVYEKEVAQLGANLDLRYWIVEDVETGAPTRLALPEGMGAVLVTFTTTAYAIHRVDREKAIDGFRSVLSWSKSLKELSKAAEKPLVFDLPPVPAPEAPSEPEPETTPETATEPEVDPLDAELALRDRLEARILSLFKLEGGEEALRTRWPENVPGLKKAGPIHYPKIEQALERAEADVGAPFDPPPSEPVGRRVVEEAPKADPKPDEGVDAPAEDVEAVRKAWLFLDDEASAWVASLADRAGNLSLTQQSSARRLLVAWSLVRMGSGGWADDEILAAVLDHAQVLSGPVTDPAPILAGLSAAHAKRLSDVVGELVEDRLTFAVGESDGRLRIAEK